MKRHIAALVTIVSLGVLTLGLQAVSSPAYQVPTGYIEFDAMDLKYGDTLTIVGYIDENLPRQYDWRTWISVACYRPNTVPMHMETVFHYIQYFSSSDPQPHVANIPLSGPGNKQLYYPDWSISGGSCTAEYSVGIFRNGKYWRSDGYRLDIEFPFTVSGA